MPELLSVNSHGGIAKRMSVSSVFGIFKEVSSALESDVFSQKLPNRANKKKYSFLYRI